MNTHPHMIGALLTLLFLHPARAQTLDHSTPPSPTANYATADCRLWLPPTLEKARATLILVPGSNGNWRDQVNVKDAGWHGLCVHCGYDLRASPDRCPECGTAIDSR